MPPAGKPVRLPAVRRGGARFVHATRPGIGHGHNANSPGFIRCQQHKNAKRLSCARKQGCMAAWLQGSHDSAGVTPSGPSGLRSFTARHKVIWLESVPIPGDTL
eukprot:CAMPEP_0204603004 /NCGR_PEP_ID=MMETSP0661-20131031/57002_1 /ASSEMBLY_ACC=CAM_ASM_000606 /TAXON_ID=109239 /ORGANISM="Alexandrium margalefi, Strain AMGDE01CS-322" /LENGTH=103 /DNA_ID=CAMNT_0051614027 /DNA_START=84 /DNA_END=395 /DNA_ORIENTATION=-